MSASKDSVNTVNSSAMDRSDIAVKREDDSLGEMINSAAMSILDGEDFTMGPVQVKPRTGKKKDHVKRPMNAFMVYAQVARKLISKSNSNLQNSEISKKLGELWRRTDETSKRAFIEKAELLRQNHKKEHPDYKYQPRRKKSKGGTNNNNNNRGRSPAGSQDDLEDALPQNRIKSRQPRGRGTKAQTSTSNNSTVPSSAKAFNYSGPTQNKSVITSNKTTPAAKETPVNSQAYSNYLYGFPGKPYHPHPQQQTPPPPTMTHLSHLHHPLGAINHSTASSMTNIPSSPADSQASAHSNLSTPPTTPNSSNLTSTAYHRTESCSPSNLSGHQHQQQTTTRSYSYGLTNSYEPALPAGKEDGMSAQGSPMILSSSRSMEWYQKYDEQCSNYPLASGNNNSSWAMNYPGYAHPSSVAVANSIVGGSGTGGVSSAAYPGGIMETDVDPKELEQYLDNPAAARKVPSSVYTSHTREDVFLDLQPGNNNNNNNVGGMQMPTSHLQAHLGGEGHVGAPVGVLTRNDYYSVSGVGSVGGGYEGRYKDFY